MSAGGQAPDPAESALSALDVARAACFQGLVPVRPRTKRPVWVSWQDRALTEPRAVEQHWREHPDHNIGVVLGPAGVAIEGDVARAATEDQWRELLEVFGPTRVHRSGGGGWHVFYSAPPLLDVQALRRWAVQRFGKAVEVKAGPQFMVWPPSTHPNGNAYEVLRDTPVAPLPVEWATKASLTPHVASHGAERPPAPQTPPSATSGRAWEPFDTEAAMAGARVGQGDEVAHRLACSMRARRVPEDEALDHMRLAWRRMEQPVGDEYSLTAALEKVRRVYREKPEGPSREFQVRGPAAAGREPALRFSAVPADQFAAESEPSAEPLLGDEENTVLPAGGTFLLHGKGGGGKTTLELDLALHLATGAPWISLAVPRRSRVLVIENEGPRGMFRRKLAAKLEAWSGPPLDGYLSVAEEPWAQFSFADGGLATALADYVRAHGVDVVCAGPVGALGAEGAGTPDEVRAFMALVEEVRQLAGRPLAVLLVHHDNKAGSVSGAWEGIPDALVHVRSLGHGATSVEWTKVRWASDLHGKTWKLRWRTGQTYEVDETPEVTDQDIREAVIATVRAKPGCSAKHLEDGVPGRNERIRQIRSDLIERGELINAGGGPGGRGGGGMRLYVPDGAPPDQPSLPERGA